jgi:hypothetical protein
VKRNKSKCYIVRIGCVVPVDSSLYARQCSGLGARGNEARENGAGDPCAAFTGTSHGFSSLNLKPARPIRKDDNTSPLACAKRTPKAHIPSRPCGRPSKNTASVIVYPHESATDLGTITPSGPTNIISENCKSPETVTESRRGTCVVTVSSNVFGWLTGREVG